MRLFSLVFYRFAWKGLVLVLVALPVFASGLGLVLFDTAYFVWIVSELFGAVLVPRLRRRGATRVKRDRGSGVLITFIGLALAVQSSGALLVLLAVFGVSYGYRMRVEERVLLSALGQDYAEYMKRTKRLIPFLI